MSVKTSSEIERFFKSCVAYWMRGGCTKEVAIVRAIWWDLVECWNIDKSWNEEKVDFVNRYRKYKPYDPIPDEKLIEVGNA